MGTPVICGRHDYMGFEPCPTCKTVGMMAANVLVAARVVREISESSIPRRETLLDQAVRKLADAIRAFDASPEARS